MVSWAMNRSTKKQRECRCRKDAGHRWASREAEASESECQSFRSSDPAPILSIPIPILLPDLITGHWSLVTRHFFNRPRRHHFVDLRSDYFYFLILNSYFVHGIRSRILSVNEFASELKLVRCPALTRCFLRNFTFYVAHPFRSILKFRPLRSDPSLFFCT